MTPDDLNDFLDYTKDIKGYLYALSVNFIGVESRVAPYLALISKVGKEEVDPIDFYECLTELHSVLGVIVTVYPKTETEILPCIKVIDHLRGMFHVKHAN